jgi:hypothetical protein
MSSTDTWWVDTAICSADGQYGCLVQQVKDEDGNPTPHLICQTHGEIVGHVVFGDQP